MTTYQYSPLNEALKEIRLLTLEPGDFSADLHVSIHHVVLSPEKPPIYEALSYVWGTIFSQTAIRVGSSKIAITQNLAAALPYLRYKDKTRTLWIDAISVDQHNLRERSSQVRMMGEIYQSADRVVVWLGTQKDNSSQILKALSQLSLEINVNYLNPAMSPASAKSDPDWSDSRKVLPYSDQELQNLDALLSRPWFSRLWVWQEIKLANHNAIVHCGSDSISWQSFRRAVFCISMKQGLGSISRPHFRRLSNNLFEIVNMCDAENSKGFGDMIRGSNFCACSDPKDRIYAILSLRNEEDKRIKIEPDYTKTTGQVYEDLVLRYIESRNLLELLRYCNVRNDSWAGMRTWARKWLRYCNLQNDRSAETPTWVPNWDVAHAAVHLPGDGRANGFSVARVVYKGRGILNVTGVISATITAAQETRIHDNNYKTITDEIRRLAPTNCEEIRYVSGGSMLDALTSTLCVNSFSTTARPPVAYSAGFEESREVVRSILQNKPLPSPYFPSADEVKYIDAVLTYAQGRSFITTKEGYMGLAPKGTKPGDQVSVLLGCSAPLILRPTATSKSSQCQYKVLGECHVHGLQDGEAFLGPLPNKWQRIRLRDRDCYRLANVDKETGKIQYEDPRLEDGDWDMAQRETIRLHDGTITLEITPEFLKRRGINVQSFDLI